jgi:hypothetical protein
MGIDDTLLVCAANSQETYYRNVVREPDLPNSHIPVTPAGSTGQCNTICYKSFL